MATQTNPEVISLDARLAEVIAEDPGKFMTRYRDVLAAAKDATKQRKLIITVEGPLGSGKSTLAGILADYLELPRFLEDPAQPHIKRYLQMLYHAAHEVRTVGALGVNIAYLTHRMQQLSQALLLASSCVLDRTPVADDIYMRGFVEQGLMTPEQVRWIKKARKQEMELLMPHGVTAPLQMIIQLVGQPETFYRRKNQRARKEEIEENGSGIPFAYMKTLTERYKGLPALVHKAGCHGPVLQITQELPDGAEFESFNVRHLSPIFEAITSYIERNGLSYD